MERMKEKNKGVLNEKELFHGTSSTNPDEIYKSEEGFDMRFCTSGMWGVGSYFAEKASYSDRYSYKTDRSKMPMFLAKYLRSEKQMFLAKVLTGDSKDHPRDSSLRMPPEKTSFSDHTVRYDTVTGVTGGSRVYIIYNNDKAFPFYLITYY